MTSSTLQTTYLKDYQTPDYRIESMYLSVDLYDDHALVDSQLSISANGHKGDRTLILNGEELELVCITLNDQLLTDHDYQLVGDELHIKNPGQAYELHMQVKIKPQDNTRLMGLYRSYGNFCTQCEANGFRRITYFIDRPDNLTVFTTRITANKKAYPDLLSNGNLIESGDLEHGRHFATWHDPFPKSSHLFALVAGQFDCLDDSFTTQSGREVQLKLFVELGCLHQCDHAMQSLKDAMRWDEECYGREYDLDLFMIVAVSDFNMGAMENKGLNIFNTKYILAHPDTATDADFIAVQDVIGHEYFHNWSGNRVGCRDWFQLSLKEGFTVFRDQSFSADMTSPAVRRIENVNVVRTHQFVEDDGPMSHPVRPASYIEMNNFYTLTVYEKGAEVIRMQYTLLGKEKYRQATDTYFQRFDGQAVTTDDFVDVMQEIGKIDLEQFRLWYSQSGTPRLTITDEYDAVKKSYTLTVKQMTLATADQPQKQALHIPLRLGLLTENGQSLPLKLTNNEPLLGDNDVLNIRQDEQQFTFIDINEKPIPSLLRGFSAPVKLSYEYSDEQLKTLLTHDTDAFCRWDAGQTLAVRRLQCLIKDIQQQQMLRLDVGFSQVFANLLVDETSDKELLALLLTLPNEKYLADFSDLIDAQAIHQARQFLVQQLAQAHRQTLLKVYHANAMQQSYSLDNVSIGQRALKNSCLHYLSYIDNDDEILALLKQQYYNCHNMTDRMAAFTALVNLNHSIRDQVITDFYQCFADDTLVLDKWFAVQAACPLPGALARVKQLLQHKAFSLKNPNKVRAVLSVFSNANAAQFNDATGQGYHFLIEQLLQLDALNPQIAARMITPLTHWQRMIQPQQSLMHQQLEYLQQQSISKDLREIVEKSLAA